MTYFCFNYIVICQLTVERCQIGLENPVNVMNEDIFNLLNGLELRESRDSEMC